MMYIIIIIGIVVLIILLNTNNEQKKISKKPDNYISTSELIRSSDEVIASSRALLEEIKANEGNKTISEKMKSNSDTGNYEEYEIVGVHIPSRKNYIINYCDEYDELELKLEKNNKFSDRAIVVKHNGNKIGYIAEYETEEVLEIIKNQFTSHISEIEYDGSYLTVQIALEN